MSGRMPMHRNAGSDHHRIADADRLGEGACSEDRRHHPEAGHRLVEAVGAGDLVFRQELLLKAGRQDREDHEAGVAQELLADHEGNGGPALQVGCGDQQQELQPHSA